VTGKLNMVKSDAHAIALLVLLTELSWPSPAKRRHRMLEKSVNFASGLFLDSPICLPNSDRM
jgi:hypothetical protein